MLITPLFQSIRYDVCDKSSEVEEVEVELTEGDIKLDLDYIKSLDAKDWKDQDHYRVLGMYIFDFFFKFSPFKDLHQVVVLPCPVSP